jgi:hypothetical protein
MSSYVGFFSNLSIRSQLPCPSFRHRSSAVVVYVLTGVSLYAGCEELIHLPSIPRRRRSRSVRRSSRSYLFFVRREASSRRSTSSAETNVSEMALETVTGSKDEACLTKDFRGCARGATSRSACLRRRRARVPRFASPTVQSRARSLLTALNFLFEIPKILDTAKMQSAASSMARMTRTLSTARHSPVCDSDNSEWCSRRCRRAHQREACKRSLWSLSDEEVVAARVKEGSGSSTSRCRAALQREPQRVSCAWTPSSTSSRV